MRAVRDTGERIAPSGELFVAGHRALEDPRRRHVRGHRAVDLVADAEWDLAVRAEHVELRHRELGERVEAMRMARRDRVEPSDTPGTARRRAVFVRALAQSVALAAGHLGRERTLA